MYTMFTLCSQSQKRYVRIMFVDLVAYGPVVHKIYMYAHKKAKNNVPSSLVPLYIEATRLQNGDILMCGTIL